jgi:hypothetical protein
MFFKPSEAAYADFIAAPIITCFGKLLITVLRASSVTSPVFKEFKYYIAGWRSVITNLSSESGWLEIYSGS